MMSLSPRSRWFTHIMNQTQSNNANVCWVHGVRDNINQYQSINFYSAPSSHLLLRSAPNTARTLCWSFTPKRSERAVWVKDLLKVPTQWLRGGVRTRDLSIHDQRRYLGATAPHKVGQMVRWLLWGFVQTLPKKVFGFSLRGEGQHKLHDRSFCSNNQLLYFHIAIALFFAHLFLPGWVSRFNSRCELWTAVCCWWNTRYSGNEMTTEFSLMFVLLFLA